MYELLQILALLSPPFSNDYLYVVNIIAISIELSIPFANIFANELLSNKSYVGVPEGTKRG